MPHRGRASDEDEEDEEEEDDEDDEEGVDWGPAIGGALIGALAGAAVARPTDYEVFKQFHQAWSPFANQANQRLQRLQQLGITPPTENVSQNVSRIIKEAASAYVYGLLEACCVMGAKSVEVSLKRLYKLIERKDPKDQNGRYLSFDALIEWAKNRNLLDEKSAPMAHDVKQLRNYSAHEPEALDDSYALSTLSASVKLIKHLSSV